MSILDQSGATPDWANLQPPNGRTIRGTQRVWGEIKREIAAAASANGIGNAGNDDSSPSPVGNASAIKPKGDASPAKTATPAKEKAVRKPRAKAKVAQAKPGRKRGNGNAEATSQDDGGRALKKKKLSEDGKDVVWNRKEKGGDAGIKTGTAGKRKGLETDDQTKVNPEEQADSEDTGGKKYGVSTAVRAGGYEASAVTEMSEGKGGFDVVDINGDSREMAVEDQPEAEGKAGSLKAEEEEEEQVGESEDI
jgi:hypothetical protein